VSDNDSNRPIIHVVWYFLMLYNCLVVLLSCIISAVGCIAINILSYLILTAARATTTHLRHDELQLFVISVGVEF